MIGLIASLAAFAFLSGPAATGGAAAYGLPGGADPRSAAARQQSVPPDTTDSGDENGVDPGVPLVPETGGTVPATRAAGGSAIPPIVADLEDSSAPVVVVPAGCAVPKVPTAVFVGELGKRDFRTAQFTIRSIRGGSVAAWAAGDQVQVRYGADVRFLEVGDTYIVGTQNDPATGLLTSKVREPAPLFGGDAVLGIDDKDVTCPTAEDPVMTLSAAALPIDSGLLTPLRHAKSDLLFAVLRPVVVAFLVLVGIAMAKQLLFAGGRSLRAATVTERSRPAQTRLRRARVLRTARRAPQPRPPQPPGTVGSVGSVGSVGPGSAAGDEGAP